MNACKHKICWNDGILPYCVWCGRSAEDIYFDLQQRLAASQCMSKAWKTTAKIARRKYDDR